MPFIFILFAILIKARLQNVKLSKFKLIFYQFENGYECKKRYKIKGFKLPAITL